MRALTNGGYQDSDHQGILPSFPPVWVNENSRVKILAWSDVRKKFRITANTKDGNQIVVHLTNGKKMIFAGEVKSGLYLHELKLDNGDNKTK